MSSSSVSKPMLAVADQIILSAAHFILGLSVARTGDAAALGFFGIGFVVITTLADVHRAALWLPMSQDAIPSHYRIARRAGALLGLLLGALGFLISVLLFAAGHTEWAWLAAALSLAIPALFVHEIQRRIQYALLDPRRALAVDIMYAAAAVLVLVVFPVRTDDPAWAVARAFFAMATAGAIGTVTGAALLRRLPVAALSMAQLRRRYAPASGAYLLNAALVFASQRFSLLIIALTLGIEATGRVEAARLLTAPLMVAASGSAAILVPATTHVLRRSGGRALHGLLRRVAVAAVTAAGVYAVLLVLLSHELSLLAFRRPFEGSVVLALLYCAIAASSILATGYVAPLGAAGDPGAVPRARLPGVLLVLAGVVPAALLLGEAGVMGLVVVEGVITVLFLRRSAFALYGPEHA